jgi:dye decolorizing peroxidase
MTEPPQSESPGVSRRRLLLATGAGVLASGGAGVGGFALGRATAPDAISSGDHSPSSPVPSAGVHQAGVSRPSTPQSSALVAVADLDLNPATLAASLATLGEAIGRVTDAGNPVIALTPDGPGDLTVAVGLGADALAATTQPALAKAVQLPRFRGDDTLPARRRGGALLISVNASDPTVLEPVLSHLAGMVSGYRLRWSDYGYRGPADQGVTRNPFGYFDGIIVPRTPADQDADVWIGDGPLAGGTICVIRRFRLNTEHFRALEPAAQDRVIGRHRQDGSPLSGGGRFDQIDLDAKTDTGDLMVPARAHARAAHPSFTGSRLMLRRSYNYRATADDHGHLFISYQNDVGAFANR